MLSKLQPASFRGVGFLVDDVSTESGRKLVTHEYPNTSRRDVEDLGLLQPTFTIHGLVTGANYMQDRDALMDALEQPGIGQLIHPFFGEVFVVAKPYSLSETMTEFGIAKFAMTFEKSDESTTPFASTDNTSLINSQNDIITSLIGTNISDIFGVTNKYTSNFTNAKGLLTTVAAAFGINANNVLQITNQISSFSTSLLTFTKNINSNINNPQNLAADFNQLFGNFSLIGANAKDQFNLLSKLFGYGKKETPIAPTTVALAQRETNRTIINSAMNVSALSNAYNTVPQLTFTTETDIQIVQSQLDEQFDYTMANNNLPDDTIQAIKDIRVQVNTFLEQQSVNAYRISTIQTPELPMTLICFQYYGNVDKTNQLLDLNNTIDSSFVEGNIKILVQ